MHEGQNLELPMNHFLLFQIGDQTFRLSIFNVDRVVRAVQITQLPFSNENILGIVDVQGSVIQVINSRKLFKIPEKDIELSDQFIIVKAYGSRFILIADLALEVIDLSFQN